MGPPALGWSISRAGILCPPCPVLRASWATVPCPPAPVPAVNRGHALQHVRELRNQLAFLRALRPNSPSYLLWIGDIAELANTVWGSGAPQLLRLAEALRGSAVEEPATPEEQYLARLQAIDAVLAHYEEELA